MDNIIFIEEKLLHYKRLQTEADFWTPSNNYQMSGFYVGWCHSTQKIFITSVSEILIELFEWLSL